MDGDDRDKTQEASPGFRLEEDEAFLFRLVDVVWGTANEDESVPSTDWAARMIIQARDSYRGSAGRRVSLAAALVALRKAMRYDPDLEGCWEAIHLEECKEYMSIAAKFVREALAYVGYMEPEEESRPIKPSRLSQTSIGDRGLKQEIESLQIKLRDAEIQRDAAIRRRIEVETARRYALGLKTAPAPDEAEDPLARYKRLVRELDGLGLALDSPECSTACELMSAVWHDMTEAERSAARQWVAEREHPGGSSDVGRKVVVATWDWKKQPVHDDGGGPLGDALRLLGIHLKRLPSNEGSDEYGFVLSNHELAREDVHHADAEHLGIGAEQYAEEFPDE
jgi:hypothetical protein